MAVSSKILLRTLTRDWLTHMDVLYEVAQHIGRERFDNATVRVLCCSEDGIHLEVTQAYNGEPDVHTVNEIVIPPATLLRYLMSYSG